MASVAEVAKVAKRVKVAPALRLHVLALEGAELLGDNSPDHFVVLHLGSRQALGQEKGSGGAGAVAVAAQVAIAG
jgi:hypothetical protein